MRFSCPYCDMSSDYRRNVTRHIRNQHADEPEVLAPIEVEAPVEVEAPNEAPPTIEPKAGIRIMDLLDAFFFGVVGLVLIFAMFLIFKVLVVVSYKIEF